MPNSGTSRPSNSASGETRMDFDLVHHPEHAVGCAKGPDSAQGCSQQLTLELAEISME
jgi:hypothetical protein